MAGTDGYCGKMMILGLFHVLFFVSNLNKFSDIVEALEEHSQAFIQTDNELRYLIDGISIHLPEVIPEGSSSSISFTEIDEDNLYTYSSPIRFEPPYLDFKEHPVGMPFMEKVVVYNPNTDTNIQMKSISGSTVHFHCSFFQDKVILPGGNTTFDVVFLGRQEGLVENTLFIHTSLGSFKYQVRASGIPNPYRLRPLLGVKMPLNSSYSPIIHMHNPYSSTLQVTEMFSSGGDLHLELPSGEVEGSQQLWEIPPYETKPVMRASFIARNENNHTAFIRIKTNSSNNDYLVLPVEVEVSSVPGIYSPTEVLDFGVLRSLDEVKTLKLNLINYGQKHIHIQNVIVTPVNDAVTVDFRPVRVPPDTLHSTPVATISFNPSKALHPKQQSGKLVVKSKNNQFKLTIPYQVTMLHGSLVHNSTTTKFYIGHKPTIDNSTVRNISILNAFNVSLIIHNVALSEEAASFFLIKHFSPLVLSPGKKATIFMLQLISEKASSLTSFIRLFTNISFFDIPLICYDGKLKKFALPAMDTDLLDFGTLGMGEKRDMFFTVINENPVDVILKGWGSNMSRSIVELVGVDRGNVTAVMRKHNISGMAKSLILRPNHYAIFRVGVTAPDKQGSFFGEIFIETSYESLKIPFSLWTAKGSLNADFITFENAFPGKISWQNFHVHSTFSQPMTVTSLEPLPKDPWFYYEPHKNSLPLLHPETKSHVGKLYFDPAKECLPNCYTGLPTSLPMGQQWLNRLSLPADVADTDMELYLLMRRRWNELISSGRNSMNITFQLHTNEVKGFLLRAQAKLHWPHLANKHRLKFPITQIGNSTIKELTIENPSSHPVIAQILSVSTYPNPSRILEALQLNSQEPLPEIKETENFKAFTLQNIFEQHNSKAENFFRSFEEQFHVQPPPNTVTLLLSPGTKVRIRVGFSPLDDLLHTSLILIRNNLTVLDSVVIQGQGGYGQIKFANKKPDAHTPLLFEMTEKHLKDCDKFKVSKHTMPNFTVKRAFTARNPGELSVYIQGFAINDSPCEGYGFKVLNCHGFALQPNASKRIEIAFTPDFTMSRIHRTLNILTSLRPGGQTLNYSLVATIPPNLVMQCANALPRPQWEPLLYYAAFSFMGFLLFCVLVAAYFESDRIFTYKFITMTATHVPMNEPEYDSTKVFDLKNIGTKNSDLKCSSKIPSDSGGNNDYIENKKKKDPANNICNNIINFAPNLFKNKKLNQTLASKPSFERQSSHEKDAYNNNISLIKDFETESENCVTNNKSGNKRKNSKRPSQNDIHHTTEPTNNTGEDKLSSLSAKGWSSIFKSSGDSNNIQEYKNSEYNRKNEKVLDNISKEVKFSSSKDCETVSFNIDSTTEKENKYKSQRKSKSNKSEETDKPSRKNKNKELVEEETSSTTTESSNPDFEVGEKFSRTREESPASKTSKNKSNKGKNKNGIDCSVKAPEADDEGDFELSTKSKAHKKVKVDHTKVYGGDILKPSTLELPYKLKTVNIHKEEKAMKDLSINKPKKIVNAKLKGMSQISNVDNDSSDKDSPPPVWDQPKPFTNTNMDDDFSELAKQTESFAQKHRCIPFDRPSTCSYSSIVSDGGKNKNLSLGKLSPEPKKPESKHPGPIGQRPLNQKFHSPVARSPWNGEMLSPSTPQTPNDPISNPFFPLNFGPSPSTQNGYIQLPEDTSFDKESGISFPALEKIDSAPFDYLWDSQTINTIPSLHSEHNQWQQHCHRQSLKCDQWPLFPVNSLSDSLWDVHKPVTDSWPSKDSIGFPALTSSNSLVSGISLPQSNSLWPDSDSVSSGLSPVSSPLGDIKKTDSDSEKMHTYNLGFDPYRSLQDIWSPSSNDPAKKWPPNFFSNPDTQK